MRMTRETAKVLIQACQDTIELIKHVEEIKKQRQLMKQSKHLTPLVVNQQIQTDLDLV
jgi:hypothetical protein